MSSSSSLLNTLLDQAQEILHKTISSVDGGVPNGPSSTSNGPPPSTSTSTSSSSSSSTSSKSKRRLTEKEEDTILLQDEDSNDLSSIFHLTEQPSNVTGTMRPYQLEGLNWLIRLWKAGVSGILADEMGLGKTLQSISLLAYLRLYQSLPGPHLILAPLSTIGNWERELNRWCPDIKVFKLHGSKEVRQKWVRDKLLIHKDNRKPGWAVPTRDDDEERIESESEEMEKPSSSAGGGVEDVPADHNHSPDWDVVLTTYEMAIIEKSQLKKTKWHYIIVDEAHRLKNENSILSQIVRFLDSKYRLLLTGTPLQNNLHELWALLNFLLPDLFHSSEEFDSMFEAADTESNAGKNLLQQLHKILRPFMLRRLKSQVETDLLPKKETLIYVGMSEKQTLMYQGILSKDIDIVLGKSKERARLMNMIMQLRKCSNHPYLFEGVEDPNAPTYGDHLITMSGKMIVLDKLLLHLFARGSRVLIFSQMTRTLDILDDYCIYRGFQYCRIDGSTGQDKREEMMREFNAENSPRQLFLLSTRAGGLGINLYTADIVILYDSDWNPQMDLQAMDRAHRIGQKKQVYVYRFVTENTIEEKIIERAEIKLRLDAMVVQAAGRMQMKKSSAGGVSNEDAAQMIRFGADRIIRSRGASMSDEDIERILERGVMKTAEMSEKLKSHLTHFDFSLDGKASLLTANPEDGKDTKDFNLQLITSVTEALGQRQRKMIYREVNTKGPKMQCLVAKPIKIPHMRDFQMFNRERIEELSVKEWKFFDKYQWDPAPPSTSGLTEAEREELQTLIGEGFIDWSFNDFALFVKALKRYGRFNLPKVIEFMSKSKTPEAVTRYHEKFVNMLSGGNLLGKWSNLKGNIELAEKRIEVNSTYEAALDEFLTHCHTRHDVINNMKIVYTNNNRDDRGFHDVADRWLLATVRQCGYGNWKKVVKEIRASPIFNFDYCLRSKNWADIKRRTDILLREIMREKKRKEKEGTARKDGKEVDGEGKEEKSGNGNGQKKGNVGVSNNNKKGLSKRKSEGDANEDDIPLKSHVDTKMMGVDGPSSSSPSPPPAARPAKTPKIESRGGSSSRPLYVD